MIPVTVQLSYSQCCRSPQTRNTSGVLGTISFNPSQTQLHYSVPTPPEFQIWDSAPTSALRLLVKLVSSFAVYFNIGRAEPCVRLPRPMFRPDCASSTLSYVFIPNASLYIILHNNHCVFAMSIYSTKYPSLKQPTSILLSCRRGGAMKLRSWSRTRLTFIEDCLASKDLLHFLLLFATNNTVILERDYAIKV